MHSSPIDHLSITSDSQRPGGYCLRAELWLPKQPDEIFPFFADAGNLDRLTPGHLRFEILTPRPIAMHAGTLIDYRLRLYGIPFRWRTEITVWEPSWRFVDSQLRGPYRYWIHEHRFEPCNGGTLATDEVAYAPLGGWLTHSLFVRRDVARIFRFRQQTLWRIFGAQTPDTLSDSAQTIR